MLRAPAVASGPGGWLLLCFLSLTGLWPRALQLRPDDVFLSLKYLQLKAVFHHREIKKPSLSVERKAPRIERLPHQESLAICGELGWRGRVQKGEGRLILTGMDGGERKGRSSGQGNLEKKVRTCAQTQLGLRFVPFPGASSSGNEVFGERGRCNLSPPRHSVFWVYNQRTFSGRC